MDRAYMLDSYIKDQDENLKDMEEANSNLNKLEFRINGSKTVDEIKKQVDIYLEKNDVPLEIEEGLKKICSEFNENTDVYQATVYLEDFMKKNLADKEKEHQESSDTVLEIKEEVIENVNKKLDDVGITITGSNDTLVESIQEEADVYKLKDNVERTTEYFEERKEMIPDENKTLVELEVEEITQVLEEPHDETLLNNILVQEEQLNDNNIDQQVEVKDDGSVVIEGDAENNESMNFAAMMTTALVVDGIGTDDFGVEQKLDMKFIKDQEHDSNFKIIYGDFPLQQQPNNTIDPMFATKIAELTNNYQSQVSYMELLGTKSPEIKTALTLIQEQVLNEKGAFQMAIKNGGNHHEMIFAVDENYNNISSSFSESGAMVSNDIMENSIIRVNDTTPGEQLLILSTTLESLRQKKKEEVENLKVAENVYQKKLDYPNTINNEAANVNRIFLIVVLVTEILLLLIGSYFLFS